MQAVNDNYLYTGVFSFQDKIYIVQEKTSRFGLRYPNVVRKVKCFTNFSITEFEVKKQQVLLSHF